MGTLGPLPGRVRTPEGAGCAQQPQCHLCQHLIPPSLMAGPCPGAWIQLFPPWSH